MTKTQKSLGSASILLVSGLLLCAYLSERARTKTEIEDINASTKANDALMQSTVEIHDSEKRQLDLVNEEVRKADEQLQLSRAVSPEETDRLKAKFKIDDAAAAKLGN